MAHVGPVPSLLLNTSTRISPNLKTTTSLLLQDPTKSGGKAEPGEEEQENQTCSRSLSVSIFPQSDHQGKRQKGGEKTDTPWDESCYLCLLHRQY